jgi:hypothetical protein
VNPPAEVLHRVLRRPSTALLAIALLAACGQPAATATIDSMKLEPNPNSVLAERVDVSTHGATQVHAVWWAADGAQHETPKVSVPASGSVTLDILGLAASTDYEAQVVADAAGGSTRSATSPFTTGPLPPVLAGVSLAVSGTPPDSYVLVDLLNLTNPGALVAFDGTGTIRWYRMFDGPQPVVEAKQLASGNYLAYVGPTTFATGGGGGYMEVRPSGDFVRAYAAVPPLTSDDHEGLVTAEDMTGERAHLIGFDTRTVDLSPVGVSGTGTVVGHTLQRLLPNGAAEFSWSSWDHIGLDEWIDPVVPGQYSGSDFDHPNSIDIDPRGNYLVSFRNLNSILLIDSKTGDVMWRLGGKRTDFTFVGDPLNGFTGQHCARFLPNGNVLLLDNGSLHDPPLTRAVEYALDTAAHTARLVWEFRPPVPVFNQYTGSALRDSAGTTWIGLSYPGVIYRAGADGSVLWTATLSVNGQPPHFYRAVPIRSLYQYLPP